MTDAGLANDLSTVAGRVRYSLRFLLTLTYTTRTTLVGFAVELEKKSVSKPTQPAVDACAEAESATYTCDPADACCHAGVSGGHDTLSSGPGGGRVEVH